MSITLQTGGGVQPFHAAANTCRHAGQDWSAAVSSGVQVPLKLCVHAGHVTGECTVIRNGCGRRVSGMNASERGGLLASPRAGHSSSVNFSSLMRYHPAQRGTGRYQVVW